ncbi:bifunctional metallophosphatase/5'-nucleotidase [Stigmatella aurantiaca]|uniref:2', 3'-cyclic nucleotide 2'-phosphodiesterase, putative n=1 Tax=Stigmatella aurantiaca (strain DW4/3-1) TaxID=378806 RepID=Q08VE9_STIAD|nr:5'-nucleotidase C-terminal domain-containing protein [Stigmatella aurantiaca]ADO70868.1 5'-nucleotidase family protein [Stigmatella aurantiaca DW4/3-1]EAU64454.1 2', 3'-cyclic nucleotide 2'-phosphodiesterase, putative [Stigmatella aurantiaca DW4/3-1]
MSPISFRAFVPESSSSSSLRRRAPGALALALLGGLAACEKPTPPPPPVQAPKDAAPAAPVVPPEVTLLVTGGVGGQLLPVGEGEQLKGGAAEILGQWVAEEKHCPTPLSQGQAECKDPGTLVLSTGDNWNGPAISSFFVGETTSAVMRRLGYAASALGNHELDYGREQFTKNVAIGGFPFLAANLKVKDAALAKDFQVPAFQVFERRGLKVGVVGLASGKTVTAAMAGRADGLELIGYEEALTGAIPQAQSAGADVLVVVADACPSELKPLVEKHADWKLTLVVGGGRCAQPFETAKVGETSIVSISRGLDKYLRAHVTFDPKKPAGQKVTALDTKLIAVPAGAGAPAPDSQTAQIINGFKEQLDQRLGEQIGFTKKGLKQDSKEMVRWITGSMREILGTDAVVINRKGLRQELPAGPITLGSIYSVLPFENSLLITKIKGADLAKELANPEALISGFTAAGKNKFKDSKGKALDPKKEYAVATIEYLYFGGDGFGFEKLDAEPTETGMAWQTPVIDWTKKQGFTEAKPLEKSLPK